MTLTKLCPKVVIFTEMQFSQIDFTERQMQVLETWNLAKLIRSKKLLFHFEFSSIFWPTWPNFDSKHILSKTHETLNLPH